MINNFNLLAKTKNALSCKNLSDIKFLFGKWIIFPVIDWHYRERIFTILKTFWLFLYQVLLPNISCREAVRKSIISLYLKKNIKPSTNTASYCNARSKLPEGFLRKILSALINTGEKLAENSYLWHGRCVKVVDGSSVSMPDTVANQKKYPQHSGQKEGCGFPIARLMCIFSLTTGIMLECLWDSFKVSEKTLFRKLWKTLKRGDVLLGDRNFSTYYDIWFLHFKFGVDCVMRQRDKLTRSIEKIKNISKGDRIILWHKSKIKPDWIDKDTYDNIPECFKIREITYYIEEPGFRSKKVILFTTMLDWKLYPKESFAEIYLKRWKVELFLNSIKITMGMETLKCKSPQMIDKEIIMHIIAYNLIRMLIYQASEIHNVPIDRISFKGAVVTIKYFYPYFENCKDNKTFTKYMEKMLQIIADDKIPHRPNRIEPRAIKKRLKRFQLLTKPRSVFKEDPHRGNK